MPGCLLFLLREGKIGIDDQTLTKACTSSNETEASEQERLPIMGGAAHADFLAQLMRVLPGALLRVV